MGKKIREKSLPKELAEAKVLLSYPSAQFSPADLPHFGVFVPDTHTAQFNYEIYKSLVCTWEVDLPSEAGDSIDYKDRIKFVVRVSNNYEVESGSIQRLGKLVPTVWFKDVTLKLTTTNFASVLNGNASGIYPLVYGSNRLKPRQPPVSREFDVEIAQAPSQDGNCAIANLKIYASLDYEQFFKYIHTMTASAYIRAR